jgi:tetratricopeptide (TPR) repeat protein
VGKLDEGIEQFQKAIELDPNEGLAYFHVGRVYFAKGMMKEAVSAFQKSMGLVPYSGWAECFLGMIDNLQGEREKAEKLLDELIEKKKKMYVSSVCLGLLAYDLDKTDMAFDFFDKAFEERDSLMPGLNVFPEYGKMRHEPRFRTLLKKMGLDQ